MAEKNSTICIIDDNPEDRAVFQRYLLQDTDYDYQIFIADTGEEGLELCRQVQPDCILLDYKLPDIDGLEFLAQLADVQTGLVSFAVIMLAGLDDEETALQAMKSGAQDYLVKDEMTPGNLFRAIHNAIERTMMRQVMEQQRRDLESKNQEVQAFAYALAHDLRAPLRAITGFAQIVQQEYRPVLDEDGRHYIDTVVISCNQMDRLIEDLLTYTRIEHRDVSRKPVPLDRLFRQLRQNLATRIAETGAQVSVAENLPTVSGDPTLVSQIFTNLLDNALTYVRSGVPAMIGIEWSDENQWAIVRIIDNGIGIAPRQYEKIFQIFQRLHGEDIYPGTGIGLAIVKKAVDLLNGQVWVESIPDQGSTFYVKLPKFK
jgi:signal transduction histidine kinase